MPDAGQKTQGTVFDAKADESLRLEALRSAAETIWTELSAYQERLASLETEESQTLRAASDQLSANDASRLKEQLAKYHESLDTALYHDVSVAAKNAFLGDSCRDTWAALAQGQTQLQAQNKVVSKMACEAIQSFADNSDFVTAVHGCQTRRREVYMQGAKLAMRAAGLWRSETVNAYVPAEQITTHLWVEHEFSKAFPVGDPCMNRKGGSISSGEVERDLEYHSRVVDQLTYRRICYNTATWKSVSSELKRQVLSECAFGHSLERWTASG